MQKSKIKVGETYQVEVDGLWKPETITTFKGEVKFDHAFTSRGVSGNYGIQTFAKVTALDQPIPSSNGGWSRYYAIENKGVLVEFVPGPYEKRESMGNKVSKFKTAVLSTRHILALKSDIDAAVARAAEAKARREAELLTKAEEFEPRIEQATALLSSAGLKPREMPNGIKFEGGSIAFTTAKVGNSNLIVGWRFDGCKIEREALFGLLSRISEAQ